MSLPSQLIPQSPARAHELLADHDRPRPTAMTGTGRGCAVGAERLTFAADRALASTHNSQQYRPDYRSSGTTVSIRLLNASNSSPLKQQEIARPPDGRNVSRENENVRSSL